MTLPTSAAIAENSDVSSELSTMHVEYTHDYSMPVTEVSTTMSQKRKSDCNSPENGNKARRSEPAEKNAIEQTTTVCSSRNTRRISTRAGLGRSVNEPLTRRTSARRVSETWSPEFLLSNPKSKLARCNLKVFVYQSVKVHKLTEIGLDKPMSLGPSVA